jgi:hypothetical protein
MFHNYKKPVAAFPNQLIFSFDSQNNQLCVRIPHNDQVKAFTMLAPFMDGRDVSIVPGTDAQGNPYQIAYLTALVKTEAQSNKLRK